MTEELQEVEPGVATKERQPSKLWSIFPWVLSGGMFVATFLALWWLVPPGLAYFVGFLLVSVLGGEFGLLAAMLIGRFEPEASFQLRATNRRIRRAERELARLRALPEDIRQTQEVQDRIAEGEKTLALLREDQHHWRYQFLLGKPGQLFQRLREQQTGESERGGEVIAASLPDEASRQDAS